MFLPALIVILVFSAMLYLRFNKGKIAEKIVYHKLMQLPEEYHVIDDVLFMSNGRSTQIDHIVVSPYAIFVMKPKATKVGFLEEKIQSTGRKLSTSVILPFIILFIRIMGIFVS